MVSSYVPIAKRLKEYPEAIVSLFTGNGKRNQKVKPNTYFRKLHKEEATIVQDRIRYAPDEVDPEPRYLTMEEASFMLVGYRNPRMFAD